VAKLTDQFCSRLLGQLIADPEFARQYADLVAAAPDIFEKYAVLSLFWDALQTHRTKYNRHPSVAVLRAEIESELHGKEDAEVTLAVFDDVVRIKDPVHNAQWLSDKVIPKVERAVLRTGALDALQLAQADDDIGNEEVINLLQTTLARASTVGTGPLSLVDLDTVQA
jgi:hypothetical protein